MSDFIRRLRGRKLSPQLSDEDVDLEQFFTDAEHACQVFEQMVGAAKPPKRLLVIHGVGGVGKSTLLKMYRLSCRRRRIPVALVGGEEVPSPVDVLADWAADLSGDDVKLSTFQATLTHYHALQAKVETEAKKASQAAEKLGKAVAKTAVEMAASAIPIVGPLATALGGAGAEAFVDWLRGFLSKPDLELYLDPTQRLTDDFVTDLARAAARQRLVLMADFYQQALIYALRYNRFLLDEVLWGGGVATPLWPIISHCLERGEEGRRMLTALRDWWQTGVNDVGTPRPDTISPIPEGIPLLEAERIARERELGDGSPQRTVMEQIEKVLESGDNK